MPDKFSIMAVKLGSPIRFDYETFIWLFLGPEPVEIGLRFPVHPSFKLEWHAAKRVFKTTPCGEVFTEHCEPLPLKHPRWRAVLIQATCDHFIQFCLFNHTAESDQGIVACRRQSLGQRAEQAWRAVQCPPLLWDWQVGDLLMKRAWTDRQSQLDRM